MRSGEVDSAWARWLPLGRRKEQGPCRGSLPTLWNLLHEVKPPGTHAHQGWGIMAGRAGHLQKVPQARAHLHTRAQDTIAWTPGSAQAELSVCPSAHVERAGHVCCSWGPRPVSGAQET